MGRLGGGSSDSPRTNPAAAASGDDPWVTHFSHPHHLQLTPPDPSQPPPICVGCDSQVIGSSYYLCEPCNYALDASCAQMPRRIRHPAHKDSMNIAIGDAVSSCRACGRGSSGFVFLCEPCGYQVHCLCAAKQLTLKHRAHQHALHLVFSPPYEEKVFSCDVCRGAGTDHWLYRCATCDFDIHIECATSTLKQPGNLQTASSSRQTEQKARPRPRGRQPSHSRDGSESSSESSRDQEGGDGGAFNFAPDQTPSRPPSTRPQTRLEQRGRGRQTQGSQESPASLPVGPQRSPAPRQWASPPQAGDGSDSGCESSEDQDGEDKGAQQTLARPQPQLGQFGRRIQQQGSRQPPAPLPVAPQRPPAPRQRASSSQVGDGSDSSSESCGDQDGENNEAGQQTLPRPRAKFGQHGHRRQQQGSQQSSAPLQPAPPRDSAPIRAQQAPPPAMGLLSPQRPPGQSPLPQPSQTQQPQAPSPGNGLLRPPRPMGQSPPPQSMRQQQQPQEPSPMMSLLNPPPQRRQLLPSQPQQQPQQQPQTNATGDGNCSCGDRYNCTCQDGNGNQGNGDDNCACGDRYNCTCGDGNRDQGNGNGNCACGNRYICICQDGNGGDDDRFNSMPNQDGGVDHTSNYYEENVEVDYSFDYHGADRSSVTVDHSYEVTEDGYGHDDSYNY